MDPRDVQVVEAGSGGKVPKMIREAARGIVAATPAELPVMQAAAASASQGNGGVSGTELPMVQ